MKRGRKSTVSRRSAENFLEKLYGRWDLDIDNEIDDWGLESS